MKAILGSLLVKGIVSLKLAHSYLIGIDGGGTSCRFALRTRDGVFTRKLGAANVYSAPQAAMKTLLAGLQGVVSDAGLDSGDLAKIPIYAGLAGVTDHASGLAVAAQLPSENVCVEADVRAAVVGALGQDTGCVVGIGTGSFLARQTGGEMRLVGGYGAVLGDEASGGWLGKRLLQHVLHVADGLAAPSPLTKACLAEFDHDLQQIVNFSGTAKPVDYGAYAPRVAEAAEQGDPVAQAIMNDGADYVISALKALGCAEDEPLCPIGGVAAQYSSYLSAAGFGNIVAPKGSALDGALELARRMVENNQQDMA